MGDLARFEADRFLHPEGTTLRAVGMVIHLARLVLHDLRLPHRHPTHAEEFVAVLIGCFNS